LATKAANASTANTISIHRYWLYPGPALPKPDSTGVAKNGEVVGNGAAGFMFQMRSRVFAFVGARRLVGPSCTIQNTSTISATSSAWQVANWLASLS
jgi:hypothetical protein